MTLGWVTADGPVRARHLAVSELDPFGFRGEPRVGFDSLLGDGELTNHRRQDVFLARLPVIEP